MSPVSPVSTRVSAVAVSVLAVSAIAGCSGNGTGSDAERFCGEIGSDTAAIVAPSLSTEADLDATLAHYRELADLAPIAIEREWRDILTTLETANTVVPDDSESLQRVVVQAAASERSALAVRDWLVANCSIDLGPVATITPHDRPAPPLVSDPADTEPGTDPTTDAGTDDG